MKLKGLFTLLAHGLLLSFVSCFQLPARAQVALPGNPKGDLATELLQSLSYSQGIDTMLLNIEKKFPSLAAESLTTKAVWRYSPFARGAAYIEQDIRKDAGKKGDAMLALLEKEAKSVIRSFAPVTSLSEARHFHALVARRAKGEIEAPMVRGNLLWNCPAYQAKPEQELLDGYHVVESSTKDGIGASVEWPMSWKGSTARNPRILQKFTSHWGHGKHGGMLRIDEIPLPAGITVGPNEMYESATQEVMEEEMGASGVTVLSFQKTKLNGRPALMMTTAQPLEQLGVRLKIMSLLIMVYHGRHSVTLQMSTTTVGSDDAPVQRLKKIEPMFLLIANSLRLKTAPERDRLVAEPPGNSIPGKISVPPPSSKGFAMYAAKEFGIAASLPNEVLATNNSHQLGTLGNFKAVDESRGSIYNITVNKITAFVEESKRGVTDWSGALQANFGGWTRVYPLVPDSLKHHETQWQSLNAIRYSFVGDGVLEKGIPTYHRGLTFLHKGSFYNVSVLSGRGQRSG